MSAILLSTSDPGLTFNNTNGNSKSLVNNRYQNLQLISIQVVYTSTATTGNRQIVLQINDSSGNAYMRVLPQVPQSPSTTLYYCFAVGITTNSSVVAGSVGVSLPPVLLPIGGVISIYDNSGLDNADSFTIRIAGVY